LKTEVGKGRKQKRSIKQLYRDLAQLGFTGSYDRVAAFAKRWRQEQQEQAKTAGRGTFIPLTFAPGDAFQFDWSEDWAVIAGERVKLQIAQFKLSHDLFESIEEVQNYATDWIWTYNHERPNMALGGITPKQKSALLIDSTSDRC
jgi:transposase InsO family protein